MMNQFKVIKQGLYHTLGLKQDGSLWAWGRNNNGQLGLGDSGSSTTPTQVGNDKDWVMITCGSEHTVGLKQDGSLWAWGSSGSGRLGLGNTTDRNTPTQVGSTKDWVMITGGYHTVGLKQDGSLWAWGSNSDGRLGLGDTTNRNTPTQVGTSKDWVMITCGFQHTLGIKQDGSLWAWGRNSSGQLGLGDNTNRTTPTQVGTSKDWVMITDIISDGNSTGNHTLGIKQDGSLWAWGSNSSGQLGLGDTTNRTTPTQVGTSKDWVMISGGGLYTVGLKQDGSLWAWGSSGQLGLGDTTDRTTPTRVGSGKDWAMITCGGTHTVGLKQDGSLWAWGYNEYGKLGLGDTTNRTTPTQVGSDKDWDFGSIKEPPSVTSTFASQNLIHNDTPSLSLSVTDKDVDNVVKVYAQVDSNSQVLLHTYTSKGIQVKVTKTLTFNAGKLTVDGKTLGTLTDGQHTLKVWAEDERAKSNIRTHTFKSTANRPPIVTLTSPTAGVKLQEKGKLLIEGTSQELDSGNKVTVQMRINKGKVTNLQTYTSTGEVKPFSKEFTFERNGIFDGETLIEGNLLRDVDYTVEVWAIDNHLMSSETKSTTIQVLPNRPPVIKFTEVPDSTLFKPAQTYTMKGKVEEPDEGDKIVSLTFSINNGTPKDIVIKEDNTWEIPLTLTDLKERSNTVKFLVKDTFGAEHSLEIQMSTKLSPSTERSLGKNHFALLTRNGHVHYFGSNKVFQLNSNNRFINVKPGERAFVPSTEHDNRFVTAGNDFTVIKKADNCLYVSGTNDKGQAGIGKDIPYVTSLTKITDKVFKHVNVYDKSVLAIDAEDNLYAWGDNSKNQLGLGADVTVVRTPTLVKGVSKVIKTSMGHGFSACITETGEVYTWGINTYGQLGTGTKTNVMTPTKLAPVEGITWAEVSLGHTHMLLMSTSGVIYGCGDNTFGQLGDNETLVTTPKLIKDVTAYMVFTIRDASIILTPTGPRVLGVSDILTTERLQNMSTITDVIPREDTLVVITTERTYYMTNSLMIPLYGDDIYREYRGFTLKPLGVYDNNIVTTASYGEVTTSKFSNVPREVVTQTHVSINEHMDWRLPENNKDFSMITGGYNHTLGLKQDGSLWAWGLNQFGKLGLGDTTRRTTPTQVGSDKDWAMITGNYYTVGLKQDGSLWAWGYNQHGQLGQGDSGEDTNRTTPTRVGSGRDWVAISVGFYHTLGLKQDGSLWSWGLNQYGELGLGDTTRRTTPTQVGSDKDWVMITGGSSHTVGLKQDGSLWSWGSNSNGQLGLGDTTRRTTPTQVGSDKDWVMITGGGSHTVGLKQDGSLWAWGRNDYGQLGLGDTTNRTTPTQVGSDKDWIVITCGSSHTLGLKQDGSLWAWGWNDEGRLGLGNTTNRTTPTQVGSDKDWVMITGGSNHTVGLKQDGSLWAWGRNDYGQLGLGDTTNRTTPTQVGLCNRLTLTHRPSERYKFDNQGNIFVKGELQTSKDTFNFDDWQLLRTMDVVQLAHDSSTLPRIAVRDTYDKVLWIDDLPEVNSDEEVPHTLVKEVEYHQFTNVLYWKDTKYELIKGKVHVTKPRTPDYHEIIPSVENARYIFSASISVNMLVLGVEYFDKTEYYTTFVTGEINKKVDAPTRRPRHFDGELIESYIYLYDEKDQRYPMVTTHNKSVITLPEYYADVVHPGKLVIGDDFKMMSLGGSHTVGLKQDGSLWSWGHNAYGQLGLGFNSSSSPYIGAKVPTQVGSDKDWVMITCGNDHTVGLKQDGSLWSWGLNSSGQLGLGASGSRYIPTQVGSAKDWVMITCGSNHTVGLKQDGSLWSWGYNNFGELGLGDNGTGTDRNIPTQVGSDTNWVMIIGGFYHTVGLKQDGSLWSWGLNSSGQLGLGNTTQRNTPTQVGSGKDWVMITCGYEHTLGIKKDGSLWSWGSNNFGRLGLGDTTDRTIPTQVGSAKDWVMITGSRGGSHTVGLKQDGSLWSWGHNAYGQLGLGFNSSSSPYIGAKVPTQVGSDKDWVIITSGGSHTVGLKQDGSLWSWGLNSSGQLGLGNTTDRNTPTQVGSDKDWVMITGLSRTDEKVVNTLFKAQLSEINKVATPPSLNLTRRLSYDHTLPSEQPLLGFKTQYTNMKSDIPSTKTTSVSNTLHDKVLSGSNKYNQLLLGEVVQTSDGIDMVEYPKFKDITVGNEKIILITPEGKLQAIGYGEDNLLGTDGKNVKVFTVIGDTNKTDWVSVATAEDFTIAVDVHGELFGWGTNRFIFPDGPVTSPKSLKTLLYPNITLEVYENSVFFTYGKELKMMGNPNKKYLPYGTKEPVTVKYLGDVDHGYHLPILDTRHTPIIGENTRNDLYGYIGSTGKGEGVTLNGHVVIPNLEKDIFEGVQYNPDNHKEGTTLTPIVETNTASESSIWVDITSPKRLGSEVSGLLDGTLLSVGEFGSEDSLELVVENGIVYKYSPIGSSSKQVVSESVPVDEFIIVDISREQVTVTYNDSTITHNFKTTVKTDSIPVYLLNNPVGDNKVNMEATHSLPTVWVETATDDEVKKHYVEKPYPDKLIINPYYDDKQEKIINKVDSTPVPSIEVKDWGLGSKKVVYRLSNLKLPFPEDFQRKENMEYLREAVNKFRVMNGMSAVSWTDELLIRRSTPIKAIHVNELQKYVTEVYYEKRNPLEEDIRLDFNNPVIPHSQSHLIGGLPQRMGMIIQALTK